MYHLGRLGGIAIDVFDNDTLLDNLRGVLTVFLDPFGTPHACNNAPLDTCIAKYLRELKPASIRKHPLSCLKEFSLESKITALSCLLDDGKKGFDVLTFNALEVAQGCRDPHTVVLPIARANTNPLLLTPQGSEVLAYDAFRGIQMFLRYYPLHRLQRVHAYACGQMFTTAAMQSICIPMLDDGRN